MPNELIFTVEPGVAKPARPISLADAGLRERSDLQEWVRNNPGILGDDVQIVTFEFDRWQARGGRAADRLDLLGLDDDGRLVVVELKRGPAPDTVEMQAIKYAAFVSRFTPETLGEAHAAYLSRDGEAVSPEDALAQLEEHVGGALDADRLREPRIALMAASFPSQVTASAVWLTEMGVDVALIEFNAYRTANDTVLAVSQVWPVRDVEDFTVSPRRIEQREANERQQTRRETRAVARLVDGNALEAGAVIELELRGIRPGWRDRVAEWLEEDPRRGRAAWRNDRQRPLTWALDGEHWSPTGLAKEIVERAAGERPPVINGPQAWKTTDGQTLSALAGEASENRSVRRDWSDLHGLLELVRAGEWTTYGDLAEAIGSSAQAVAGHVARCPDSACQAGYRVLTADGQVAEGFYWGDSTDARDPATVLALEGVTFVGGRAHPSGRVNADSLRGRA